VNADKVLLDRVYVWRLASGTKLRPLLKSRQLMAANLTLVAERVRPQRSVDTRLALIQHKLFYESQMQLSYTFRTCRQRCHCCIPAYFADVAVEAPHQSCGLVH